ncbi:sensor domain-containing diguanylate cyclase [Jeongeupia naejangsanensis]|uniref:diguanylate cyclase n=1 Tax=Jeongeupia naejangsanensis TaxID=613195 RepID=A0ABS2BFX7_9NEIS|nr:sensor domain-containing diguanylate cyclase [Jeongeupia naejangsanensis]MBM3114365.1 sensor domain-containing diguanylate cyclase [Jeongeupia naejangsanensis]
MNELQLPAFRLIPVLVAALSFYGGLSWLRHCMACAAPLRPRLIAVATVTIGGGLWVASLCLLLIGNPGAPYGFALLPLLAALALFMLGPGIALRLLVLHRLRIAGRIATGLALALALLSAGRLLSWQWAYPPETQWVAALLALVAAAIIAWAGDRSARGVLSSMQCGFALVVFGQTVGAMPLHIAEVSASLVNGEAWRLLALILLSALFVVLAALSPVLAELLIQPDNGQESARTAQTRRRQSALAMCVLLVVIGAGGGWTMVQHHNATQMWAPQHDVSLDELSKLHGVRQSLVNAASIQAWRSVEGEQLRQSWLDWRNQPVADLGGAKGEALLNLPTRLDEAAGGKNATSSFQSARELLLQTIDARQQALIQQLGQMQNKAEHTGAVTQAVGTATLVVSLLLIPGAFWLIVLLWRRAHAARAEQQHLKADVLEREALSMTLQRSNEVLESGLESLRRHLQDVSLQRELGRMLECCQTFDEARDIIRTSMAKLFPESAGQLFIDNPVTAQLEEACRWGELPRTQTTMAPDDCWGVRLGQAHWLQSPQHGPRCRHVPIAPVRQSLCIPMTAQGRNQGVVTLLGSLSRSESQFSDVEHQLALSVAEQISLAIANLQLRETLKLQSISDPLTGLFNRRYLEECLRRELARAKRNHGTLGVAMIDIDYFKRYNDTYGHEAGDAVLRALAQCLLNLGRADDVVCRFGGEEFTVLLPGIDHAGLTDWGERLMAAVRLLSVDFHGQRLIGITISIGAMLVGGTDPDTDAPLELADAALYAAKREGRNRLRWWTPSDPSRAEAERGTAVPPLQPTH